MEKQDRLLELLWKLPLACFIVAGLTGFLYRLGLIGISLGDLNLENIRHAHSHLMFFGWAVPLPMYFMIRKIGREIGTDSQVLLMQRSALATLLFGFASYPFFLFYGYRPVPLGGAELPLSVILSGLVMLSWYGFIYGYMRLRKRLSEDLSLLFYEGALVMLFVCSLGAWGVAVVQFIGPDSPLYGKALTHFFLATFTEGWIVLALLGLLHDQLDLRMQDIPLAPGLLIALILFGAPLTFPYGISESLLTPPLLLTARLGGLLAATGLVINLYVLYPNSDKGEGREYWKLILLLLSIKVMGQLMTSVLPSTFWLSEHGLRILYLHLLLLGAFSLGFFKGLHSLRGAEYGLTAVTISIVLVLVSLVLLTPLWPSAWFASWQFYIITAVAGLPSLAVVYYGWSLARSSHDLL